MKMDIISPSVAKIIGIVPDHKFKPCEINNSSPPNQVPSGEIISPPIEVTRLKTSLNQNSERKIANQSKIFNPLR